MNSPSSFSLVFFARGFGSAPKDNEPWELRVDCAWVNRGLQAGLPWLTILRHQFSKMFRGIYKPFMDNSHLVFALLVCGTGQGTLGAGINF
jgi:hypothetical protein